LSQSDRFENISKTLRKFLESNRSGFGFQFPSDIPLNDREQLALRFIEARVIKKTKDELDIVLSDDEISFIKKMVEEFLISQE
jgi:hypothetical protein